MIPRQSSWLIKPGTDIYTLVREAYGDASDSTWQDIANQLDLDIFSQIPSIPRLPVVRLANRFGRTRQAPATTRLPARDRLSFLL